MINRPRPPTAIVPLHFLTMEFQAEISSTLQSWPPHSLSRESSSQGKIATQNSGRRSFPFDYEYGINGKIEVNIADEQV